jgi:hypothetical protein
MALIGLRAAGDTATMPSHKIDINLAGPDGRAFLIAGLVSASPIVVSVYPNPP